MSQNPPPKNDSLLVPYFILYHRRSAVLTIFAFSILINISRFFELRPVESTEKVIDLVNGTLVLRWVGSFILILTFP